MLSDSEDDAGADEVPERFDSLGGKAHPIDLTESKTRNGKRGHEQIENGEDEEEDDQPLSGKQGLTVSPYFNKQKPATKRSRTLPWLRDEHGLPKVLNAEIEARFAAQSELEKARGAETTKLGRTGMLKASHAEHGIYIANIDAANKASARIAGYLNFHNADQLGLLWDVCREALKALGEAHCVSPITEHSLFSSADEAQNEYDALDGAHRSLHLKTFMKALEDGKITADDIGHKDKLDIKRFPKTCKDDRRRLLYIARFLRACFAAVSAHRESDKNFPDVFSGACKGVEARLVPELDWDTEDCSRAFFLWCHFKHKHITNGKLKMPPRWEPAAKPKPIILPIFVLPVKEGSERAASWVREQQSLAALESRSIADSETIAPSISPDAKSTAVMPVGECQPISWDS